MSHQFSSTLSTSRVLELSKTKNRFALQFAIALLAVSLGIAPTAVIAAELIVTGISGTPRANGVSLLMHDRLSERAEAIELETNERSTLSVLYGTAISLQIGPSTRLLVHPATDERGELIELVRGELRTVTRRDQSKKRPEIHTPSAVIRPSTTTLHFFVNPVTGDTDVTSLESRAWVMSSDPNHKQSAILNSGQLVTIRMGEVPGSIQKVDLDPESDVTGFLSGRRLRDAAFAYDIAREGQIALNQIALNDVPDTTLPSVASPFPTPTGLGWNSTAESRTWNLCGHIRCDPEFPDIPDIALSLPPICGVPRINPCRNP